MKRSCGSFGFPNACRALEPKKGGFYCGLGYSIFTDKNYNLRPSEDCTKPKTDKVYAELRLIKLNLKKT